MTILKSANGRQLKVTTLPRHTALTFEGSVVMVDTRELLNAIAEVSQPVESQDVRERPIRILSEVSGRQSA
jgi:hypothetical protein